MQANAHDCDSALHVAARFGDVDELEELLASATGAKKRALLDCLGLYRWTALQEACANGEREVVDALLQHGTGVQTPDGLHGRTALHYAAEAGQEEIVRTLLAKCGLEPEEKRRWMEAEDDDQQSAAKLGSLGCQHIIESEVKKLRPSTPPSHRLHDTARITHGLADASPLGGSQNRDSAAESHWDPILSSPNNAESDCHHSDPVQPGIMLPLPGGISPEPEPTDVRTMLVQSSRDEASVMADVLKHEKEEEEVEKKKVPAAPSVRLNIAFEYNAKVDRLKVRVKQLAGLPMLSCDLAAGAALYIKSTLHPGEASEQDSKRKSDEVSLDSVDLPVQDDTADSLCLPPVNFQEPLHYKSIGNVKDRTRTIRLALCCRHGQWLPVSEELAFVSLPLYQAVTYLMPRWYDLQLREVMQKSSSQQDNRRVEPGRIYALANSIPQLTGNLSICNNLNSSAGSGTSVLSAKTLEDYLVSGESDCDNDSLSETSSLSSSMWARTTNLLNKITLHPASVSSAESGNQRCGLSSEFNGGHDGCVDGQTGEQFPDNDNNELCEIQVTKPRNALSSNLLTGSVKDGSTLSHNAQSDWQTRPAPSRLFQAAAAPKDRPLPHMRQHGHSTALSAAVPSQVPTSPNHDGRAGNQCGSGPAVTRVQPKPESACSAPRHLFQSTPAVVKTSSEPVSTLGLTERSAVFPANSKATPVDLFQASHSEHSGSKSTTFDLGTPLLAGNRAASPAPVSLMIGAEDSSGSIGNQTRGSEPRHPRHGIPQPAAATSRCKATAPAHLFQARSASTGSGSLAMARSAVPSKDPFLSAPSHTTCRTAAASGNSTVNPWSQQLDQFDPFSRPAATGWSQNRATMAGASSQACGKPRQYPHAIDTAPGYFSDETLVAGAATDGGPSLMQRVYAASADDWNGGMARACARDTSVGMFVRPPQDPQFASWESHGIADTLAVLDPVLSPGGLGSLQGHRHSLTLPAASTAPSLQASRDPLTVRWASNNLRPAKPSAVSPRSAQVLADTVLFNSTAQ